MRPFKPRARAAKTSMQMRHEGYGGGLRAPSWPKLPCPPPHGLRAKTSTPSWSSLQMRHVAPPPDRDSCLRGGWGGEVLHPNTAAAASARGRGGPRAAEDGAKRHSSGGDRCLGVRVSLIMLVWNSGKPVLFRVQWLGRPGARRGTAPPHGVEKRVRIWIGPNISNTVPLGQSSSTWRVCGPPRSGRASSSRPRSRTRTRATRRRHTTRTNLTNSPIHYIKVVPRTTVSRLPYPMLGVAARSRDPTIS